jgi:hypothetical protein
VVYMSGYAESIVSSQGVIEPAGVFLQKPVTPDALVHTVREGLDTVAPRIPRYSGTSGQAGGARSVPHGHQATTSSRGRA